MKHMLNPYINSDDESEEGQAVGEELSTFGFHPAEDNEEEADEESAIDTEADAEEADFDLSEEGDEDEESDAPLFGSGPAITSLLSEDEDEGSEELDAEETDDELEAEEETSEDEDEELAEETEEELEEEYSETQEEVVEDNVIISKAKIMLARQLMDSIQKNSARLNSLFSGLLSENEEERITIAEVSDGLIENAEEDNSVIEGVFNGENMIGPDGKEYSVPANYASKSKLVEGDMLKLTITDRGTFVYKQTKPVDRKRLIGKLDKDADNNFIVFAERKKFNVLTASITYYKGVPGDKVVILIPISGESQWAAVENVIKSK